MTRKEALTVKTKIIASTDASRNGLVENIVTTPEVEFLINKIYDDFEKEKEQLKKDRDYWKLSFEKQIEANRRKTDV